MFIWRLAHNSLPVRRNLARRGVKTETVCPVCYRLDEDCGHLFFKCKMAKECWRMMNLEHIRAELEQCRSGKETVMRILSFEQKDQNRVFIWLWRWWSARNKANVGERMATAAEISNSVSFHMMEFEKMANRCITKPNIPAPKWKPPPVDHYKINVDASFFESTRARGWGFVVRDCEGKFLEGGAGSFPRVANALQAETLVVKYSLQRAADLGMTRIVLETDASIVGRALMSTDFDRSPNGCLFRQIHELMMSQFAFCSVSVCARSCNKVADSLASYGCTLEKGSCMYMNYAPDFVLALVSGDLPRASE